MKAIKSVDREFVKHYRNKHFRRGVNFLISSVVFLAISIVVTAVLAFNLKFLKHSNKRLDILKKIGFIIGTSFPSSFLTGVIFSVAGEILYNRKVRVGNFDEKLNRWMDKIDIFEDISIEEMNYFEMTLDNDKDRKKVRGLNFEKKKEFIKEKLNTSESFNTFNKGIKEFVKVLKIKKILSHPEKFTNDFINRNESGNVFLFVKNNRINNEIVICSEAERKLPLGIELSVGGKDLLKNYNLKYRNASIYSELLNFIFKTLSCSCKNKQIVIEKMKEKETIEKLEEKSVWVGGTTVKENYENEEEKETAKIDTKTFEANVVDSKEDSCGTYTFTKKGNSKREYHNNMFKNLKEILIEKKEKLKKELFEKEYEKIFEGFYYEKMEGALGYEELEENKEQFLKKYDYESIMKEGLESESDIQGYLINYTNNIEVSEEEESIKEDLVKYLEEQRSQEEEEI